MQYYIKWNFAVNAHKWNDGSCQISENNRICFPSLSWSLPFFSICVCIWDFASNSRHIYRRSIYRLLESMYRRRIPTKDYSLSNAIVTNKHQSLHTHTFVCDWNIFQDNDLFMLVCLVCCTLLDPSYHCYYYGFIVCLFFCYPYVIASFELNLARNPCANAPRLPI